MRTIWVDRVRVERRKLSLTALLGKVETFRTKMAVRYDHLMDDKIPVQRCAMNVKALLIARLYIMVLHRYNSFLIDPVANRLKSMMVSAGAQTLETAIALETIPSLRCWTWYGGAFQQYHTAFLLINFLYVAPDCSEADRIWPCLDYIFECDTSQPRRVKARRVLSELQRKTAIYQNLRGIRAPVVMENPLEQPVLLGGFTSPNISYRELGSPENRTKTQKQAVGKASLADVVFAGVANGEALWAMPNAMSPEATGSEASSTPGMQNVFPVPVAGVGPQNDLMADIDWVCVSGSF